jgi:hypothetical protein
MHASLSLQFLITFSVRRIRDSQERRFDGRTASRRRRRRFRRNEAAGQSGDHPGPNL